MVIDELVERVAKAICEAEGLRWEDQSNPLNSGSGADDTEHYLHVARAAIQAIDEAPGWVVMRVKAPRQREFAIDAD